MHPQPHPHLPGLQQESRSQPQESLDDIIERFDLGDGRRSRYDPIRVIEGWVIFLYGCENWMKLQKFKTVHTVKAPIVFGIGVDHKYITYH